jgi:type IV pilus assembly protein PilA
VLGKQSVRLIRFSMLKGNSGFTLLELLVVIVITGILAAIALPAFLSRVNSAKQAEAKVSIGSLNRAQQAYYIEHAAFSRDIFKLGIAVQQTANYQYSVSAGEGESAAVQHAESKLENLRPYVGMSALVYNGTQEIAIGTILCEADIPATGRAKDPIYERDSGKIDCRPGTRQLK